MPTTRRRRTVRSPSSFWSPRPRNTDTCSKHSDGLVTRLWRPPDKGPQRAKPYAVGGRPPRFSARGNLSVDGHEVSGLFVAHGSAKTRHRLYEQHGARRTDEQTCRFEQGFELLQFEYAWAMNFMMLTRYSALD